MKYFLLLSIFGTTFSTDSLKRTLSQCFLIRKDSSSQLLQSLVKDPLRWENALEKSWTTANPDGTSTEWFQVIDGTIYYVNQDGIREIYVAKQKTLIRRIFDRK